MSAPSDDEDLVDSDDYYSWLGVSREATQEEIQSAFRRLSRIYHPDKHQHDEQRRTKAENLFMKLQRAHEVLSDPHQRAIYDTLGCKGLETDGWEVVKRTRTPAEILEEYQKLKEDREQRLLQQQTNQKGNITVSIDASDIFEPYIPMDGLDYRSGLPTIEISSMNITQSVEAPLTVKNTAVLGGSLNARNGTGSGSLSCSLRHVMSHNGWVEGDVSFGKDSSVGIKGFRNIWNRGFGTMSGSLQFTPNGIRPVFQTMLVTQLDKNLQGRLQWIAGGYSSMTTSVTYDSPPHRCVASLQLAVSNPVVSISYNYTFLEQDAKVKLIAKAGWFGAVFEYGCEKKITKFSNLGASMMLGTPVGVTLKIKLLRGNQVYLFPIHLSEAIMPSAVFYGTTIPLVSYFVIKYLLVNPFLKEEQEKKLQKKREANLERMEKKRQDAAAAIDLMQESVARSIETEEKRKGLIIVRAVYGKLTGDNVRENECIDVTVPLQALVKDSKIQLGAQTDLSELPGFYDPCIGEDKQLVLQYLFRRQPHSCTLDDKSKILLPCREHLNQAASYSMDSSSGDG